MKKNWTQEDAGRALKAHPERYRAGLCPACETPLKKPEPCPACGWLNPGLGGAGGLEFELLAEEEAEEEARKRAEYQAKLGLSMAQEDMFRDEIEELEGKR